VALALAARQAGEDELADSLAPAILRRLYLAPRLGTEAIFWVLAASSYGALGAGAPETVEVEIDGARRRVRLDGGVADLAAPPGASIRVRSASPVWVRVESRTVRAPERRDDAPIRPSIAGEIGGAGERASLELVLESTSDEGVSTPVVEIALPSAAVFDAAARAALERSPAVLRVEGPDPAGVVRLHLAVLRGRSTQHLPLSVRWLASGDSPGLALVAYDAWRPWAQTIRPARAIVIEEAR
jgi:hypothetical protein